jgi:hypothetical protein
MTEITGPQRRYKSAQFKGTLIRELAAAKGTRNLFEWLRRETEQLAKIGFNGQFVELNKRVFEYFDVVKINTMHGREDVGAVRSAGSKYQIEILYNLPLADRRFVIAHELSHIFWIKRGSLNPISRHQSAFIDADIEYLCDLGAAYLLCPDFALHDREITTDGWVTHDHEAMAKLFLNARQNSDRLLAPFSAVLQRTFERLGLDAVSLAAFKIERQQPQLDLFDRDFRPKIRLRDIYLRNSDEITGDTVVVRKQKHMSAHLNNKRERALKNYGSVQDFMDIFDIPHAKMGTLAQIWNQELHGAYYRLADHILVLFTQQKIQLPRSAA